MAANVRVIRRCRMRKVLSSESGVLWGCFRECFLLTGTFLFVQLPFPRFKTSCIWLRIPHPRALVLDLILLYVVARFKITLASYWERQFNFCKLNINKIAFMPQILRFSKSEPLSLHCYWVLSLPGPVPGGGGGLPYRSDEDAGRLTLCKLQILVSLREF